MVKSTPGPWIVTSSKKSGEIEIHSGDLEGLYIYECIGGGANVIGSANARLISAAPDLLDALEALLNAERHSMHIGYDNGSGGGNYIYTDVIRCDDAAVDAARAAIAKATGK